MANSFGINMDVMWKWIMHTGLFIFLFYKNSYEQCISLSIVKSEPPRGFLSITFIIIPDEILSEQTYFKGLYPSPLQHSSLFGISEVSQHFNGTGSFFLMWTWDTPLEAEQHMVLDIFTYSCPQQNIPETIKRYIWMRKGEKAGEIWRTL